MIWGIPPGKCYCFACAAIVHERHNCPARRVVYIPYETWREEERRVRSERELLFLRKWVYGIGPKPPQPLRPVMITSSFLGWIARALNGQRQ